MSKPLYAEKVWCIYCRISSETNCSRFNNTQSYLLTKFSSASHSWGGENTSFGSGTPFLEESANSLWPSPLISRRGNESLRFPYYEGLTGLLSLPPKSMPRGPAIFFTQYHSPSTNIPRQVIFFSASPLQYFSHLNHGNVAPEVTQTKQVWNSKVSFLALVSQVR